MRPVGYHVLVRPFFDDVKYKQLLHLPDTAKSKATDGMVVSVGEWTVYTKPGDWVIFSRKQAHDIDVDGIPHIIVDERAISLILEDKDEDSGS